MRYRIRLSGWLEPAVLLLVAIIAFGLLIPWLGFYWDDWAKILVARVFGLSHYVGYYAEDRPLSAWTHIVFTPILGTRPLAWQIFELALRWLSALGFWACLGQLWPAARRQNLAAALIFLVYPVFIQQPASVTFFQQWLQYALFFLSLFAMLAAQRELLQKNRARFGVWTGVSLLAMLLQISVTEYFVPVELIRPVVLWIGLANHSQPDAHGNRRRVVQVLKNWVPYLVVLAAFTVWRLFFIRLSGADPYRANTLYDFLKNPLGTLGHVFQVMLIDGGRILFGAWIDLLNIQLVGAPPFNLLSYGVGALAGAGIVFLLLRVSESGDGVDPCWLRQALGLGIVAVLLGPVPAWITGRQVVFDFHSDRYALPAMFGASLLWVSAVEWLVRARLQKTLVIGALIALAIGLHLRAANDYRWIWTTQQRLYWELAWRAPGIKAPTALLMQNEPFPNQGLFSTSAAINQIYPQPKNQPKDPRTGEPLLGYWMYTLLPRYNQVPDSLDISFSTQFRTLKFDGQTPDSLLLYKDTRFANCLWVLSSRDASHPYLTKQERAFLPVSNLDRIRPVGTPGYPPQNLIGPEKNRSWCYFFEKADLARQMGDWEEVSRLGHAAQVRGFGPDKHESDSPYEWLPFIEGYARTGQEARAAELTRAAYAKDPKYRQMLCEVWGRVKSSSPQSTQVIADLSCEGKK